MFKLNTDENFLASDTMGTYRGNGGCRRFSSGGIQI